MSKKSCLQSVALYCVLLVSALTLVEQICAHPYQESLPPLVLDEAEQQSSSVYEKKQPQVSLVTKDDAKPVGGEKETSTTNDNLDGKIKVGEEKIGNELSSAPLLPTTLPESKLLIPYETSSPSSNLPKLQPEPIVVITSQQSSASNNNNNNSRDESDLTSSKTDFSVSPASEKDLKSLLEGKNDAENDLAATTKPNQSTQANGESPKEQQVNNNQSPNEPVDSSLDSSSSGSGNKSADERYHYSMGSAQAAEKPSVVNSTLFNTSSSSSENTNDDEEEDQDETAGGSDGEQPLEAKKEPNSEGQAQTTTTTTTTTSTTSKPTEQTTLAAQSATNKSDETTTLLLDEKKVTTNSPATMAQEETEKKSTDNVGEKSIPEVMLNNRSEVSGTEIKPIERKELEIVPSSSSFSSSVGSPTSELQPASSQSVSSDKNETPIVSKMPPIVPALEISKDLPKLDDQVKSSSGESSTTTVAATTTTPTTTVAPTSVSKDMEPSEKKQPVSNEQSPTLQPAQVSTTNSGPLPSSTVESIATAKSDSGLISSAAASAAAAAAGSSLGTALAKGLSSGKTPSITTVAPNVSILSTTTTTTKLPNSMRKSTTDKWNRWPLSSSSSSSSPSSGSSSSSSTTNSPPTRRRPILPSIRRRFRPYNRFSPFPWTGPEPYLPIGSDEATTQFGDIPHNWDRPHSSAKPRRRPTSSPTESSITTKLQPNSADDLDSEVPLTSTTNRRRRPLNGDETSSSSSRRRDNNNNHNHHHHHHRNRNHNRERDEYDQHHHHHNRRRHHNHPHHRADSMPDFNRRHHQTNQNKFNGREQDHHHHHLRPSHSYGLEPFAPLRPLSSSSSFASNEFGSNPFGLFNSGLPLSSSSSAFDLLNPLSWIDEVTKPIRPQQTNFRPNSLGGGGGGNQPTHLGSPGRPSGQPPVAFEGEYGGNNNDDEQPLPPLTSGINHRPPLHTSHNDNNHHHRQNPNRPQSAYPIGSAVGGRENYDDDDEHYHHNNNNHHHHHHHNDHHNHNHHCHEYEHEHDGRDNQRPATGNRPPFNDYNRPVYGGGGGVFSGHKERPPYKRGEEEGSPAAAAAASSGANNSGGTIVIGDSNTNESSRSLADNNQNVKPVATNGGERISHRENSSVSPRRVSSVFSPFNSLFGSIDDELFGGGLRSSFIDSIPLKATATATATGQQQQQQTTYLDSVVSSPKISLAAAGQATTSPQSSPTFNSGGNNNNNNNKHESIEKEAFKMIGEEEDLKRKITQ